ncbi:MFS transporter [Paenibacillus athensensis]|uniref:MFS transporter n=1 Tax=Paenibacillus athensensis TaxID=1967502 RepID=A0A4Y8PT20_9BACL|nr:MFS transporter [Paenibacillus athensensis]MCD1257233.1 MFS transporter [Paenibacillus athensensis]
MQKKQATSKLYYGWVVIGIVFVVLLISAGINSMLSVLMLKFEQEFGWDRAAVSGALSLRILLYGLMGPFAAALMQKLGVRRVMVVSMLLLAASLMLTPPFMKQLWQFFLLWGVVMGVGTGMMANSLSVTVANRWFIKHRGLVVGLLTASAATGQLLFLPLLAKVAETLGWRYAVYLTAAALLLMLPVVAIWMRNHPADKGLPALGASEIAPAPAFTGHLLLAPLRSLAAAARKSVFWLLAGTFFFCGFSTNGLIGTHLIPACGDVGIPIVVASSLLALMGVFDMIGTTLSGWLSDRFDSRWLLLWYYGLRGLSLIFLPQALGSGYRTLLVFAVFYGLDWIATVPPTVRLTSDAFGKEQAGMIFGWIAVAHQIGASTAAYGAGLLRQLLGSYSVPFMTAGFVCLLAAVMALHIRRGERAGTTSGAGA